MRYVCSAAAAAFLMAASSPMLFGQASALGIEPADVTVGQNLEAAATVSLHGPVPKEGLKITITSDDPTKLLLSPMPDVPGTASIVVNLQAGIREPDFFLQGVGKSGTATYTASAPGYTPGKAKVTLAPSGLVIAGPFGVGKTLFQTTTGIKDVKIVVYSALLDASMNYVTRQVVAGGRTITASLTNSNPAAGKLSTSALKITGGSSSATTLFQSAAPGETVLAVNSQSGLSNAAQFTSVTAKVITPGMSLSEDLAIGKNLQAGGGLSLGEPAPAGGLVVKLVSSNPEKLLLSNTASEKGSGSITVTVPAGGTHATYYMQALTGDGPVTYSATAPGYVGRTAKILLAPSGVVVAGPLSFTRAGGSPGFVASLAAGKPTLIICYTAYLDPKTHRSADVTVQPLRPGVTLKIALKVDDPELGTIASPVTIESTSDTVETYFTPKKAGRTVLSVITPEGYTPSANATALKVIVTE